MPILKVKNNGTWMNIGSNADTLDGKHAEEFAQVTDVEELKTLVGDETVSSQISTAMANTAAGSAIKLETARKINGVEFDGTQDINIVSMGGVITEGDGTSYTATVPGIESMEKGVSFIMCPQKGNTITNPTLNVNGLGAQEIRRRTSGALIYSPYLAVGYLVNSKPIRVTFNGTYWIVDDPKPDPNDLNGFVNIEHGGTGATTVKGARDNLGLNGIIVSSDDGVSYTATVPGITTLTVGNSFIMIPSRDNANNPTLNVNGLGAKALVRRFSGPLRLTDSIPAYFLSENIPIEVIYDGTQWIVNSPKPAAEDLVGAVPIANGGTGATTASDARTNLEVCQSIPDSTYPDCHYRMNGTTKEWINPPMIAGTEYRTTERYENKPVYVKLVNFGAMPNTGTSNVTVGTNLTIVSIDGKATSGKYVIPIHVINSINSIYYHTTNGTITIETSKDASSWTAVLIVKYTK